MTLYVMAQRKFPRFLSGNGRHFKRSVDTLNKASVAATTSSQTTGHLNFRNYPSGEKSTPTVS